MMGYPISEVRNIKDLCLQCLARHIAWEMREGFVQLRTPNLLIVSPMKHCHPKTERHASNHLTSFMRNSLAGQSAQHEFNIASTLDFDVIQEFLIVPPILTKFRANSVTYSISQSDFYSLIRNGEITSVKALKG